MVGVADLMMNKRFFTRCDVKIELQRSHSFAWWKHEEGIKMGCRSPRSLSRGHCWISTNSYVRLPTSQSLAQNESSTFNYFPLSPKPWNPRVQYMGSFDGPCSATAMATEDNASSQLPEDANVNIHSEKYLLPLLWYFYYLRRAQLGCCYHHQQHNTIPPSLIVNVNNGSIYRSPMHIAYCCGYRLWPYFDCGWFLGLLSPPLEYFQSRLHPSKDKDR